MAPLLSSFCGLLSLQVGSVVISAILFTLSLTLIHSTMLDYQSTDGFPWSLLIVIFFIVLLTATALTTFVGAYFEYRPTIYFALFIMVISFIYWIIFVTLTFSLYARHLPKVCIGTRCAVSCWLIPIEFKDFPPASYPYCTNSSTNEESAEKSQNDSKTISNEFENIDVVPVIQNLAASSSKVKEKSKAITNVKNIPHTYNKKMVKTFKNNSTIAELNEDPDLIGKHLNLKQTKHQEYNNIEKLFFKQQNDFVESELPKLGAKKQKNSEDEKKIGFTLAAVYLVLITLMFFVFSMCILWSYGQQILIEEQVEQAEVTAYTPPYGQP